MGKRKGNITGLARFLFDTAESDHGTAANTLDSAPSTSETTSHPRLSRNDEDVEIQRNLDELEDRPAKKAKLQTGLLGPNLEKYDATGLVPFYMDAEEVPEHLQKYFSQRERFFSLYSSGCLLDEEGWYSVTPEAIANQIAERCRCDVILDAFCGVGGNAIAFAKTCERVIALDISPVRLALARHNAALYGVQDRIEFILCDFFSFARTLNQHSNRKIDVVFLSPPWGGPSYITSSPTKQQLSNSGLASKLVPDSVGSIYSEYGLDNIRPIHGADLFGIARGITHNIAYFLPRNISIMEVSGLLADVPAEKVEVEEEWMGSKLKALTCYFGGLASGQEHLFDR